MKQEVAGVTLQISARIVKSIPDCWFLRYAYIIIFIRELNTEASGRLDKERMVLQSNNPLEEEGSTGSEEKVLQEAGHPGWDVSR